MKAEVIGVNNRSVLRIDASRYADADGFNLLKSVPHRAAVFLPIPPCTVRFFRRLTAENAQASFPMISNVSSFIMPQAICVPPISKPSLYILFLPAVPHDAVCIIP